MDTVKPIVLGCKNFKCVVKKSCYKYYCYQHNTHDDIVRYPKGTKDNPCELFVTTTDVLGEDVE